jgi:hypothetical protein
MKIKVAKNCNTCVHEYSKPLTKFCKTYCKDFSIHEYSCNYCVYRLTEIDSRFCMMENSDGSQNCAGGDHFEFDNNKFEIA